jgi:hypothetical protein
MFAGNLPPCPTTLYVVATGVKCIPQFINFTLINKVKRLDIKKQSDKIEEYLTNGGFNFVQKNLYGITGQEWSQRHRLE